MRTVNRSLQILGLGAAAIFFLLAAAGPAPAGAGEEGDRLTEKEYRMRRSKLRTMAGRWITHRKRFPSRCPLCRGRGKIVSRKGMRKVLITCTQCDGHRAWLSTKDYRKAYYDMRSPAFREMPGVQDQLNRQYKTASAGNPWPTKIDRYRIREWEMVDATHGIVWFLYNASRSPTATYWIWIPKGTGDLKRGRWCLYDSRGDGAWPSGEGEGAPTGDGGTDGWEPVTPAEGQLLRAAVGAARVTWRAYEFLERGDTLCIRLKPWADAEDRPLSERIGPDALNLYGTLFPATQSWSAIEAEWRVQWRDANGRIVYKTAWTSTLARNAFDAVWQGADPMRQLEGIDWDVKEHDGWTLVHGDHERPPDPSLAPAPASEPSPEPAPAPDEPARPEPTPPEPPRPEPAEPAPTPQPRPSPSPPPEPESWELPEPSAKERRDGARGIERMREVFELAKQAYNEGVAAHRAGSHDVWQEKLSEARAHLQEMEETWITDVAGRMPGRDEGEQDAVANEQFGEIWDEVYKLKAMVRKMSSL
jgi:hypothetical protein